MPITDDNSLVSSYIRNIENPDSIGFVNNRWYKSPYDANARGFGVDVVYNDTAKKMTEGREGKYLTVDEEREIRNSYIDKLQETIDRKHLPNFSNGNISPRKRTMATGLLYRGDGINTNPELKKAYYEGTDRDFQNAVSKYYKAKHLPERARLHDEFWKDYDDKMFIGPRQESPSNSKPLSILSYIKADGGKIDKRKTWQDLSIRDKAAMMRAAVGNGIYKLSDIKKAYNEFAEGGPENSGTPRPITTGGAGYIPPAPTSIPFTFNPDRIVQDVPAREWGPTPISFDENGELSIGEQGAGNGGIADSMYYYLLQRGNKLGDKNIEIALSNLKNNPWYFNEKIPDEDISFAFSERKPGFAKDNISKATTDQKKALAAHYIADSENYLNHAGAMRRYFGKDDLGVLRESAYKPGISKDPNSKYYIFNNMLAPSYWDPVVEDLVQSEEKSKHYYDPTLNEFTASKGHDNTGDYVSIYDIWDYNTNVVGRKSNSSPDNIKHVVNGKPFDIYHRVYLDDYYDVPNNKKGSYFLPEVTVYPNEESLGGPIIQTANSYAEGGPEEEDRILDLSDRGYKSKEDLKITGTPPLVGIGPRVAKIAEKATDLNNEALYTLYNTTENLGKWIVGKMPDKYKTAIGELYNAFKQNAVGTRPKEGSDFGARLPAFMQRIADSVSDEKAYGGPLLDLTNRTL